MIDSISLRQVGTVNQYHDAFISLLNQLQLPEQYALSIFISNLKTNEPRLITLQTQMHSGRVSYYEASREYLRQFI